MINIRYEFVPYIWLSILVIIIIISLAIYTWKKNSMLDGTRSFIYTFLLIIMWNVCQGLEIAAIDLKMKIIWYKIQYIPIGLIPPFVFLLVVRFTRGNSKRSLGFIPKILLVIPIVFNVLLWGTNFNRLIIKNAYIRYTDDLLILKKQFGPLFWIFAVYNILLIISTLVILGKSLRKKALLYKEQIIIVFIGILLPSISMVMYILGIEFISMDITPVVFGISGVIVLWARFIYGLFDIIPIARSVIVQEISTGIIVLDNQGRILDINPAARNMVNITALDPIGISIDEILSNIPEVVKLYKEGKKGVTEIVLKRGCSCDYYEISVTKLKNSNNNSIGYLMQIYDITERKIEEESIKHAAFHDSLTGLPNRIYFKKLFNKEVNYARDCGAILTIAYLDLDDFKYINDTYGHGIGDLFLCEVSKLLKETVRKSDIVSRFGGDEYVILLPSIKSDEDIKIVANKILKAFQKSVCVEAACLPIKASIGFSMFPRDGEDIDELLKKADIAMYKVKGESKNNFGIYKEQ